MSDPAPIATYPYQPSFSCFISPKAISPWAPEDKMTPKRPPKRGRSAFLLWSQMMRPVLKKENKYNSNEMMVVLARLWKNLSEKDKEPYQEQAAIERKHFREALDVYCAANPGYVYRNRTKSNHVKKPCSAYAVFVRHNISNTQSEHPDKVMSEHLKILAQEWHSLTEGVKKFYIQEAKDEIRDHSRKKQRLTRKLQGLPTPKKKLKCEAHDPDCGSSPTYASSCSASASASNSDSDSDSETASEFNSDSYSESSLRSGSHSAESSIYESDEDWPPRKSTRSENRRVPSHYDPRPSYLRSPIVPHIRPYGGICEFVSEKSIPNQTKHLDIDFFGSDDESVFNFEPLPDFEDNGSLCYFEPLPEFNM